MRQTDLFEIRPVETPDVGGRKQLRPYQKEAVENAFREFESVQSTLIVLPTGCGKSVVFSEVMRRWLEDSK